jgi:hypothetical protein
MVDNIEKDDIKKAIDVYTTIQDKKLGQSDNMLEICDILEDFLRRKGLLCYGGLALNNILPKTSRFYEEYEMPDYDVYSTNPPKYLTEIADIFYKRGYTNCYAASNPIHIGSYKLFINYIGVLDVTHLPPLLYSKLFDERILANGISYTPVNFLRRSVYNELSNPEGDISRFDKVFSRLSLVDKHYHIPIPDPKHTSDFSVLNIPEATYTCLTKSIIQYGGVFFGGYAISLYSKYLHKEIGSFVNKHKQLIYAFVNDPKLAIDLITDNCAKLNIKISHVKHAAISDVVGVHYEILLDDKTCGVLFTPIGCHSYNIIRRDNQYVNIATIYTILHMYYSFIYIDAPYYNHHYISCMTQCLYHIKKPSSGSHIILKPFPVSCYGSQHTREEIFQERSDLFKEYKTNPTNSRLKQLFYRYSPGKVPDPKDPKDTKTDNIIDYEVSSELERGSSTPAVSEKKQTSKKEYDMQKVVSIDQYSNNHKHPKHRPSKSRYSGIGSYIPSFQGNVSRRSTHKRYNKYGAKTRRNKYTANGRAGIFNIYRKSKRRFRRGLL